METVAVNIKTVGDIPGQSYDIFVGRPSKWGNPFKKGRDGTLREVLRKYREHILASPELMAALPELKGRRLACFCVPSPCHAQVLVDLVEEFCP